MRSFFYKSVVSGRPVVVSARSKGEARVKIKAISGLSQHDRLRARVRRTGELAEDVPVVAVGEPFPEVLVASRRSSPAGRGSIFRKRRRP